MCIREIVPRAAVRLLFDVRRIVSPARSAFDKEIMNLVALGVHQYRAAMPAAIIDGVCAGSQDGRGSHNSPNIRRIHNFEAYFRTLLFAHDTPIHRREHENSQPPTPGRAAVGDVLSVKFHTL